MDLQQIKRKVDNLSANLRIREKDKLKALERLKKNFGIESEEEAIELREKLKKDLLQIRKRRDHFLKKIETRMEKYNGLL
jgi:adenylyl- and sulfurtransferase ThiI